ncbi:MAG: choice-of-anchor J domain-containing protein [Flavobacteriaceae bacterium]|nr:choice-of-anchor J domain-containing protein [Flavobacteriaceae bacterium]
MNRANKILTLFSALTVMVFLSSCVDDDDYSTPNIIVTDPGLKANATFRNLVSRYLQAVSDGDEIAVIEIDEGPLLIEGYVVSSDQAGNFFEEIVIQNKVDGSSDSADPRLGFNVEVNVKGLYETYEVGRKVFIKMNGLAIGESHGVYTIGKPEGNDIGQIQEFEYRDFIIRSTEVVILTPKLITIGELTEADENTLIQLENMQVHRNSIAFTYAGEPSDEFDGFRTLESCDENGTIALQTSTFSDFKSLQVPQNKGTIQAIFTRDFGDDNNVLVINSAADIVFDNTERCDPVFLNCTGSTSSAVTLFNEDFQSITSESQLDALGWTNVNVSGGSERYEDSSFSGDTYIKISAFGTGENPLEAWLVTPAINLDGTTQEELSFNISANFETGQILTAFITENFTGDPTTTEWDFLDADIPIGDGGFGSFVAKTVNISCLSGDVHVAFKYLGAAGGAETRYHIDDIKVTGM